MTQELPKYLKDETGFCYVATPQLMTVKRLTPYDGEIDAHGMAIESEAKPVRASRQGKLKVAKADEPAGDDAAADDVAGDEYKPAE